MIQKKVKKRRAKGTRRTKFNWPMVKSDWLLTSLQHGGTLPLEDFIKKHKMSQAALYKRMNDEDWATDLAKLKASASKAMLVKVEKKLVANESKAILDEIKVRVENFKIATTVVDPLIKEFQRRMKEDKEAIKSFPLAKLIKGIHACLDMRKQAAGLPDRVQVAMDLTENDNFQTVAGHIESHKNKMKLLGVIAALMKENKMLKDDSVDI